MAFQQGLSGLNTASKALDVTSNNIANASTVGFKTSATHFADVYAASLSGGGASQVGIGSSASAIVQQYTQGNITTTSNSLDIAINGSGFYRMSKDGAVTYSRNGQFHVNDSGFIVNDSGANLTGYLADANGNVIPTTPAALRVSTADIAPQVTGSTSDGVKAELNLDSTKTVPTSPWVAPTGTNTPLTDTYNFSTATTIYDTLGNAHTLTMYFRKSTPTAAESGATPPATSAWDVHYQVDGTAEANVKTGSPLTAGQPVRLAFGSSGKLLTTMPIASSAFEIDLNGVMTNLGRTNNAEPTLAFNMNFSGTTQYGSSFSVGTLIQDGYAAGHLAGLSIGKDGVVQGNYSNGQTRNMAQIVLANFTNPNGLMSVGNNGWIETAASGQPLVGAPNTGTLGVLQSGAVEESNVDLTGELVSMIVQQRNYQASAQSIKTQDQIMQTMVNLK